MHRLLIELSSIPQEGLSRQFSCTGATLGISDPGFTIVRPCDIECHLIKVTRDVVVHGTLRTTVRLVCSRCAEDFLLAIEIPLEAVYLPAHEASSERAKELEDSAAEVYPYTEHVIDIAEMVRDKLFLSIPLQPHCTVGCKGLCPSCGINRNAISCQCAEETFGSPFELLKELRLS